MRNDSPIFEPGKPTLNAKAEVLDIFIRGYSLLYTLLLTYTHLSSHQTH